MYAKYFSFFNSEEELLALIHSPLIKNNTRIILGGGSNILLTESYDGLIIKNNIKGIMISDETSDHVFVTASAGETWHQFVLHCISNNWGGLENLSLIPGTVGAAPMQNIGAYGVEIKDVFRSLTAIHKSDGTIHTFDGEACKFGYRESVFKHDLKDQFIVSSVTFKLTKKNHNLNASYGDIKNTLGDAPVTIQSISDAVIKIRQTKLPDPAEIGNSGSFFKNPSIKKEAFYILKKEYKSMPGYELPNKEMKVPAGWLIEQCGWKGKRLGNVGVHDRQALVLVNFGKGTGNEIKELSIQIQESVLSKFKIALQAEVNFI